MAQCSMQGGVCEEPGCPALGARGGLSHQPVQDHLESEARHPRQLNDQLLKVGPAESERAKFMRAADTVEDKRCKAVENVVEYLNVTMMTARTVARTTMKVPVAKEDFPTGSQSGTSPSFVLFRSKLI